MMSQSESSGDREPRSPVRNPQSFVGGLALIALAVLALYLTRDLPQGTLRAMGPAMLPRWLAIAVGLCGVALIAFGLLTRGEVIEQSGLRGPVFVMLAILAFAVTIRPFSMAGVATPGLGLVFAGPLAIMIGGYGTNEARLRELVILSLTLTPFCMVLFGDALGLAIPMFPQSLAAVFPADWSQKFVLRVIALVMVLAAGALLLLTRQRHRHTVDVPDHSGQV
jgi:hypothetical protein